LHHCYRLARDRKRIGIRRHKVVRTCRYRIISMRLPWCITNNCWVSFIVIYRTGVFVVGDVKDDRDIKLIPIGI